jgi:hypothetical protein
LVVAIVCVGIFASTSCSTSPVECFVNGGKLNPTTNPLDCFYENGGSLCTDGHSRSVDCELSESTCTCYFDGQPSGTLQKDGTECGTALLFNIPDTTTRFPPLAKRCGWDVIVTSQPACPPNCVDAAVE